MLYTHIHTSMLVYVCVSVLYMTYIHHMPTVGTGSVVFNVIFQYCIIKLQPATNLITQISYFVFFFSILIFTIFSYTHDTYKQTHTLEKNKLD